MRVVALFMMIMRCILTGRSFAVSPPQPIATLDLFQLLPPGPVTTHWTKNVSFVSDFFIAVGLCEFEVLHPSPHVSAPRKKNCSLTLLRWEGGVLRPVAQTHQFSPSESIHLTSEARVLATPFGKAPATLYSSDLSAAEQLPPLHYSSQSGNTVAEITRSGWKLYHLDSSLHPIRDGAGRLESLSDEVIVFRDRDAIRTETLGGKALGFFRAKQTCRIQVASPDSLFVSECGSPQVVDYSGKERSRFRRPDGLGISRWNWSADGKRVLLDHFSRKISVLRNIGEYLVMFASFGFGVADEHNNRERVQVIDATTENSCFDLHRAFAENSESSTQNAFLSPSGDFVAVVIGNALSVYHLPTKCEKQK